MKQCLQDWRAFMDLVLIKTYLYMYKENEETLFDKYLNTKIRQRVQKLNSEIEELTGSKVDTPV